MTIPTYHGHRHRSLFEYGRCLKSHPAIADVPVAELKPYARQWWEAAEPTIRTKSFDETWFDFIEGWDKIRNPKGAGYMDDAMKEVAAATPPTIAMRYEDDKIRRLITLCRELQRKAGEQRFFLAGRTAAEAIGIPPRTAATWLSGLAIEGVLRLVKKGDRPSWALQRQQDDR